MGNKEGKCEGEKCTCESFSKGVGSQCSSCDHDVITHDVAEKESVAVLLKGLCVHCQKKPRAADKQNSAWCSLNCRSKCWRKGCHRRMYCLECLRVPVEIQEKGTARSFCSDVCEKKELHVCAHCTSPKAVRFVDDGGIEWPFCKEHRKVCSRQGCHPQCVHCGRAPAFHTPDGRNTFFCRRLHKQECEKQKCHTIGEGETVTACQLSPESKIYKELEEQFVKRWKHSIPLPKIYCIAEIQGKFPLYDAYQTKVEGEMQVQIKAGKRRKPKGAGYTPGPGNERRRYHGTNQTCLFGTPGENVPCKDQECSTCAISRSSFDLSLAGAGGFDRFGKGIYVTCISSKGADYAQKKQKDRRMIPSGNTVRSLMVILGHVTTLTKTDTQRKGPDPGDHSVFGQRGGDLNYEENVVYDERAICPRYIIHYFV